MSWNHTKSNMHARNIIRRQNDDLAIDILDDVETLKQKTQLLNDIIQKDKQGINDIYTNALTSNSMVNDIMKGFDTMIGTGSVKMTCYLACFMVFTIILIYALFLRKK
mmetsp:Transcript_106835/g.130291  ORF Transcript_106835/g.130291 Transcript_106835/m.130291 type:complete len:108 (-) Transcript_106835:7-330(-)